MLVAATASQAAIACSLQVVHQAGSCSSYRSSKHSILTKLPALEMGSSLSQLEVFT